MSKPSIGSGKPSSWGEHIMPWLVTPKTLRSLMTKDSLSPGFSGRAKFGKIRATLSPGLWFCAPQMIVRSVLPSLTLQTESLSEPATLSRVRICATTMPSNSPASLLTPSTSRPSMVRRSASSSEDQSNSTYCLSQLRVTFMESLDGSSIAHWGHERRLPARSPGFSRPDDLPPEGGTPCKSQFMERSGWRVLDSASEIGHTRPSPMRKVALVFVLAVVAPSLALAWLALRSLR